MNFLAQVNEISRSEGASKLCQRPGFMFRLTGPSSDKYLISVCKKFPRRDSNPGILRERQV